MKHWSDIFIVCSLLAASCIAGLTLARAEVRTVPPAPLAAVQAPQSQATVPRPTLDPTRMPLTTLPLNSIRTELNATPSPTSTPRPTATARSSPTSTPRPTATARSSPAAEPAAEPVPTSTYLQQRVPEAGNAAGGLEREGWLLALALLLLLLGGGLLLAGKVPPRPDTKD